MKTTIQEHAGSADLFTSTAPSSAVFSPCRSYRYELWRRWEDSKGYVMFVGLNPSTADERQDDPTIRRCIAFAKMWGYGALCMTNLFAYRATQPSDMIAYAADPVGPQNDTTLQRLAVKARLVVAAWGNHGSHKNRDKEVCLILPKLHCLKLNQDGSPGHPLYLPSSSTPIPFQ